MEKAICDDVVVAPHNKYKCISCREQIKKGLPAIRKGMTGKYGYQSHSFCYRCYKWHHVNYDKAAIKDMADKHKEVLKKFKKVEKECMKALILKELEDKQNDSGQS